MPKFSIEVRIKSGLNQRQSDALATAAKRWAEIIVGDFPRVRIRKETIQALVINARGMKIDGPGTILGQSWPSHFLPNGLPAMGSMEFDKADLAEMEQDNTLESVILHEMGHVLGIGTIWDVKGFLVDAGRENPRFVGAAPPTRNGRSCRACQRIDYR